MKKILIPMLALGGALALQPALAQDGEALFKSKPCAACHSIDAKLVGPAFRKSPPSMTVRTAPPTCWPATSRTAARASGVRSMPPNPVTEEEAKILAEWVLSHK